MSDLLIQGTDTGAGKTSFAVLWLTAFADRYDYWKPLETGEPDSLTVERLVPAAFVHPPCQRFAAPVAPLLASRQEQKTIPLAEVIAASRPRASRPGRQLLVETFGSPFSPLNDTELQVSLIRALKMPSVLVTSSAVGAIGRCLQCLLSLAVHAVEPHAVVLLGDHDPFAVEQLTRHWRRDRVWSLQWPTGEPGASAPGGSKDDSSIRAQGPMLDPRSSIFDLRSSILDSRTSILRGLTPPARPLVERDRMAVWHPYTALGDADAPLVCTAAQDEFLHLEDGRRVIDAISSWWTILHGHRHPVLLEALAQASTHLDHVHFAGITHESAVELAELMLRTTPWPDGRVFFSDNGSTAVEVALKMAYQFWCHHGAPQRSRFIGFVGGYHGDTFGAMAVSRDPVFFGRFEPLLCRASIIPLSADALEAELARHHREVAAIIVEPLVQGAGGMRMHTSETLRDLCAVARRHNVLLIADEVMTGCRTGNLWAHQAAQVTPDLVCAGKTLAGGVLPLAATLVAPHLVAAWQTDDRSKTFFHGHSFTAHPLACAVGVANWKKLLPAALRAVGPMEAFWRERLLPLQEWPQVRDVRVCGSIVAVELEVEGGYLASVGRNLRQVCLEHGVLCRPLGQVLYAMPPLLTSRSSLAQIADAMSAAVQRVTA
jgi:adenosylmethionine-8-amino-7-oxononanoate aminotransferase